MSSAWMQILLGFSVVPWGLWLIRWLNRMERRKVERYWAESDARTAAADRRLEQKMNRLRDTDFTHWWHIMRPAAPERNCCWSDAYRRASDAANGSHGIWCRNDQLEPVWVTDHPEWDRQWFDDHDMWMPERVSTRDKTYWRDYGGGIRGLAVH